MNATTFNTKQEYLAWRTRWRAAYAELSKTIRSTKAQRKGTDAALAQCRCWRLRLTARAMLAERVASKISAQQQYQAAKAAALTACPEAAR